MANHRALKEIGLMMNSLYYLKCAGKTLGPFKREQVESLRARGRLKTDHLISSNRKSWKPVDEFFEEAESHSTLMVTEEITEDWYYVEDQRRIGPISRSELIGLFANGTLSPDDLVWRDGLPDWIPACSVPELLLNKNLPSVRGVSAARKLPAHPTHSQVKGPVGALPGEMVAPQDRKDRMVAALLAFFLGGLGVHHFYLGNMAFGIIYILFCWTLIPSLVAFVEGIVFLTTSANAFDARYNTSYRI